ncbi:MAG: TolC family protein [Bacteroidaceae bacterium]|nr:TolC family protein [Bacteroidaceae bacterium]
MKKLITLPAVLFIIMTATAQKQWSLSDCINYAIENNLSVRRSQLTVQQQENELSTSKARRMPGVSAGASQNFSFGRGLTAQNTYDNTNTTNTSFSVGADMTLFQGFSIRNGIEVSRLNLEAATADLEKARDDIRVAVAKSFVQILFNKEILQVARNQVSIDSVQVERITLMVQNGKASLAELSAQKASLAQSRLSCTQARNNLNLALLDLTQLLELASPEGFDIEVPDVDAFRTGLLGNPEDIYAEAVAVKPAIRSEEIRLNSAERNISIAKSNYYPSLSLSAGLSTNYYTTSSRSSDSFGSQLKNNFGQSIGLSLRIPIYNRLSTRNGVRSAQISYMNQQLQLENARKSLYKEIQQAYYNAVASESKYVSSTAAEASAREAFDIMEAKYEEGKADITDYNQSKGRWIEAASNLAQARYDFLYQTKILDFYRGKDLSF